MQAISEFFAEIDRRWSPNPRSICRRGSDQRAGALRRRAPARRDRVPCRAMAASRTAQFVALFRAFETYESRRMPLFRDPYAMGVLSRGLALAVRASRVPLVRGWLERYADRRAPGSRTSAIARTAYIDDAVRTALADGLDQLVIL